MTSEVRPLVEADLSAVADLFHRILLRGAGSAPAELASYLGKRFLHDDTGAIAVSNVYQRADGRIIGFMGAMPMPMVVNGRQTQAAVASSLMVEGHETDPLAGARLMRNFLAGPQEISLSETASDISMAMWRNLRCTVLPAYSLDWIRVIRPVGFAVDIAAAKRVWLRPLTLLAGPLDAQLRRPVAGKDRRWSNVPPTEVPAGPYVESDADDEALVRLLPDFVERHVIRPLWDPAMLREMLREAADKPDFGPLHRRIVSLKNGMPVGAYLYNGQPGRTARVLQLAALPNHLGRVLDGAVVHAGQHGMVAIRGRVQPWLLDQMLGRRIAFTHVTSTVVQARDPAVLQAFMEGKAFINGLAGEGWTRMIGGRFN